jgi:hypothetical protein
MADPINDLAQFRKRILVASDVANVSAGARCSGAIGTRKTLHGLYFDCRTAGGVALTEAQIAADVLSVVIRVNGVVIRDLTSQEILDLYQHYKNDMGLHTVAGIIPIEFAESAFDLSQINGAYAMGMMLNGKPVVLTYEIVLANPLAQLASMRVRLLVDDREMEFGLHKRIIRHVRTFNATGNQDITDLPKGDGSSSLLAYHFITGAGTIQSITVKDGDQDVYNQVQSNLMDLMINDSKRKAQAGYFHVPFNLDNDPRSKQAIGPQTANWLVQPNWSVSPAGNYTILEEREHSKL